MKRAWLWFIRHTLNRLTIRIARSAHGPFAVVRHVGRRSGIVRETPINAVPVDGGFIIALTYGPDVEWYRNVRAAGTFVLTWHRVPHTIVGFEHLKPETGRAAFGVPERWVLRLLRRRDFVRLVEAPVGRIAAERPA